MTTLSPDMSDTTGSPLPLGEIVQGPSPFEQFLDRHQTALAASAVALAIAIGGFMVYRTIQEDQAISAGHALSAAKDLDSLQKVQSDYPGTPAAVTAQLAQADKLWNEGQQDQAIENLRQIITHHPTHPASALAQQSLGLRLFSQGKNDEAISALQEVIARTDARYLAPAANIALGDIAKSTGKKEQAAESYRTVSREFPDSPFANIAAEKLKYLDFIAPTEIEAPPAVNEPPPSLAQPDAEGAKASTGNPLIDGLNSPKQKSTPKKK